MVDWTEAGALGPGSFWAVKSCKATLVESHNRSSLRCLKSHIFSVPTEKHKRTLTVACLHRLFERELKWDKSCVFCFLACFRYVLIQTEGVGGCFLQFLKMKLLNVFKRCCLSSNLYDRGLFLTFAYAWKEIHLDRVLAKWKVSSDGAFCTVIKNIVRICGSNQL